jgi:hypothetical protein
MAINAEIAGKILERMRARYRQEYPHQRLILCFDRRADAKLAYVVFAVDRNSPWFDLLPDEQVADIEDATVRRQLREIVDAHELKAA